MYVVPMLFAFTPILLLNQPLLVAQTFLFSLIGFLAMGAGLVGFLYVRIGVPERLVFGAAAIALFWPVWWVQVAGAATFAALYFSQRMRYIKEFGTAPTRA